MNLKTENNDTYSQRKHSTKLKQSYFNINYVSQLWESKYERTDTFSNQPLGKNKFGRRDILQFDSSFIDINGIRYFGLNYFNKF